MTGIVNGATNSNRDSDMEINGRRVMSSVDALFDPIATAYEAPRYLRPGAVRTEASVKPPGGRRVRAGLGGVAVRSLRAHGEERTLTPHARLISMRIVKACKDHASASRYQNLTLSELSGASGVSERRVRYAFYDCYKMSPIAYLRVAALDAVRARLLQGPVMADAVTRAASDFGFWHLGRFAGQYRVLFGELPSETIAHRSNLAAG